MNQLYPYQTKGAAHLLSKPFGLPHALLADAPGTGKTVQAIEAAKQAGCKTGIIVCPAIIKEQWKHQMVKWGLCKDDDIQVLYGLKTELTSQPWLIANYELIRTYRIREQILKRQYHVLILDEVQRLKTHNSQQTHSVFHKKYGIATRCYWKWCLSGTIVPNRPIELYPILKTLAPQVIQPYDSWSAFIGHYCGGAYLGGRGASNVDKLTAKLQPFMLRRALKDVWQEMPKLIENEVWLDVPFEKHPEYLGDGFMETATLRRVIAEAKIFQIGTYIDDRLTSGINKIVVFTYHRKVITQLDNHTSFAKIYGGQTSKQRLDNLNEFLTNPDCHVIMIQIGSGGEGLDGLQEVCNEVIEAEPEWSPGREDQAIARIMRLGQTKPVILTKLLAANSYEQIIHNTNHKKRKVIDVITKPNGGQFTMAKTKTAEQEFSIEENIERMAITLESILKVMQPAPKREDAAMAKEIFKGKEVTVQEGPTMVERAAAGFEKATTAPEPLPKAPTPMAIELPTGPTREAFEKQVLALLQPKGEEGLKQLTQTNAFFGCVRLSEVPEDKFSSYLQEIS